MKSTVVVMSSNRSMEPQTKETLNALAQKGANLLMESGSPDVAFARNRALSFACNYLRENPERRTVLMVDDDMQFPPETAQELVNKSRELGRACSAVYATISKKVAAARWKPGLWVVGLGCLAIPRELLLELEERSESFEMLGKFYTAFTWCGPSKGEWIGEDFRLSMNLGGVHLCPLPVGHIKKGSLWPDDETIAELARTTND